MYGVISVRERESVNAWKKGDGTDESKSREEDGRVNESQGEACRLMRGEERA